ncbi:MAG: hypothetical protein LBU57_09505 [Dysgonamonadaceae bacterium]|jgi:predicted DNA-binding transcriptional regulator YafY|nr:hypothetical protein [Dysgonamonadaceae bacterium]
MNYVKTSYLAELCKRQLGYSVSQRTIQLDLEAMKYDSFLGIFAPIEYCRKRKAYFYIHTNFTLTTFNFSEQELEVLCFLCKYLNDKIDEEYYHVFEEFVSKIKKIII